MANHISHAALPYPIYGARYTLALPFLDATGAPIDPTTPDTEISKDGGASTDCTEEVTPISTGAGYITLTSTEMTCDLAVIQAKAASGPKTTLAAFTPRRLPILASGTAQAGAAGTITLAAGASAQDDYYVGCIVRTTGGTGGAAGACQARVIMDYVGSTQVATIAPNWETNPANDTTYDLLLTEMATAMGLAAAGVSSPTAGAIADAVCDEALSGHSTAGSLGAALALLSYLWPPITGAVVADAGNTASAFKVDRSEATQNHWKDALLVFTSGTLSGQVKKVTAYDGTTKFVTTGAFTAAPAAGTTFVLVNR